MATTKEYDNEFYEAQYSGSLASAKIILPLVLKILPKINSAVDFGCGRGTWLSVLKELGVNEIKGYDGQWVEKDTLLIPEYCFSAVELDKTITLKKKYDLAISVEVAEHLPEETSNDFVKILTTASDIVLFSAAIPHQGGRSHINEQWQEYWYVLFSNAGYIALDCIRDVIWDNPKVDWWYRQNIILYVRKEIENKINIQKRYNYRKDGQLNIIHPEMYIKGIEYASKDSVYTIPLRLLYKVGIKRTIKKILGKRFFKRLNKK
jgi:hypothetical protein